MLKINDSAPFDLLSWLEGKTSGHGVFEDRKGRMRRRFDVQMTGATEGNGFRLDERFQFADGEKQLRIWRFHRNKDGSFSGRSDDSASEAVGQCEAGVAFLSSELRLKVGKRLVAMRFQDAFYRLDSGLVLNRSRVSKWGIGLGQVIMLLRKDDQRSP